jgi:hypothetical protein
MLLTLSLRGRRDFCGRRRAKVSVRQHRGQQRPFSVAETPVSSVTEIVDEPGSLCIVLPHEKNGIGPPWSVVHPWMLIAEMHSNLRVRAASTRTTHWCLRLIVSRDFEKRGRDPQDEPKWYCSTMKTCCDCWRIRTFGSPARLSEAEPVVPLSAVESAPRSTVGVTEATFAPLAA